MQKRIWVVCKKILSIVGPGAMIAGGSVLLYGSAKRNGMGEICDWCDKRGFVVIQNDLGPDFKIIKTDLEDGDV